MIEARQDREGNITIFTAKGGVTVRSIHNLLMNFYSGEPTLKVLCDFSKASLAALSTIELEDIIEMMQQYMKHRRGGRIAVVVDGAVDYGVARMFATFAEIAALPVEVQIYHQRAVARDWLDELDRH